MKTAAVIAEYNPFHKGHEYHIHATRQKLSADYLAVIMSGDYVQRGEPAIASKYLRAEAALRAGADLVLELPVHYSLSSAEFFASGAIAVLDRLGVVDQLSFGSESADLDSIREIADFLADEPAEYAAVLKAELKKGKNYAAARSRALRSFLSSSPVIDAPNDILAVEYLKALKRRNSNIIPHAVKRLGSYRAQADIAGGDFMSAAGIRELINPASPSLEKIYEALPGDFAKAFETAINKGSAPLFPDDLSQIMIYRLLTAREELSDFADVSQELAATIKKKLSGFDSFSGFCGSLCTKNYTMTHISRCLMHILLDIKKSDLQTFIQNDWASYATVLGFKESSRPLLRAIKDKGRIKLLTKNADAKRIIDPVFMPMFEANMKAACLYRHILSLKYNSPYENPWSVSPVILP